MVVWGEEAQGRTKRRRRAGGAVRRGGLLERGSAVWLLACVSGPAASAMPPRRTLGPRLRPAARAAATSGDAAGGRDSPAKNTRGRRAAQKAGAAAQGPRSAGKRRAGGAPVSIDLVADGSDSDGGGHSAPPPQKRKHAASGPKRGKAGGRSGTTAAVRSPPAAAPLAITKLFGPSGGAVKAVGSLTALLTKGGERVEATLIGEGAHAGVYKLRGSALAAAGISEDSVVAKWAEPLAPKDMAAAAIGNPEKFKTWRETYVHDRLVTPMVLADGCPHFPVLHGWYHCASAGRALMVMERGEMSLEAWGRASKRSETEWLAVLFQLYHALAAMQHKDMLHFDVKWENVLMRRTANSGGGYYAYTVRGTTFHVPNIGWQAMLCDFGLAHVCDPCHEPAFYNDKGRKRGGWVAVYGCDRSRLSADLRRVENDGQLVAERTLGSKEVRFRDRASNSNDSAAVGTPSCERLAARTFANDRRFDTRELARSFEPGALQNETPTNLSKPHTDHGVKVSVPSAFRVSRCRARMRLGPRMRMRALADRPA